VHHVGSFVWSNHCVFTPTNFDPEDGGSTSFQKLFAYNNYMVSESRTP